MHQDSNVSPGIKLPDDYARLLFRLQAQIHVFGGFNLAADYYFRQFLNGNGNGYSYAEISPIYYFDEDQHFSVGLTYKIGNTTPDFSTCELCERVFWCKVLKTSGAVWSI